MAKTVEVTARYRAENRFTEEGFITINMLALDIGEMLQVNNAHITASPCTDIHSKQNAYHLTYDTGKIFLGHISNERPNSEITQMVAMFLKEMCDNYARVFYNSSRIFDALVKREEADNANAAKIGGLLPYTLESIGIVTAGANNFCGRVYLVLIIDGLPRQFIRRESHLEIIDGRLDKLAKADEIDYTEINSPYGYYVYNGRIHRLASANLEGITVACRDTYKR